MEGVRDLLFRGRGETKQNDFLINFYRPYRPFLGIVRKCRHSSSEEKWLEIRAAEFSFAG